jgi:LPS export ABC transporter protein LptC
MGREEIDTENIAYAQQTRWAVSGFGGRLSHLFFVAAFMSSFAFLIACNEVHEHTADAIHPEDSVSMMTSYGVKILISDSGVIKYRVITERWEVNTVRQPSRWEFMKGVFFEQFDEKFEVQAYVQSDTAWYYDQQNLWKLRGRVYVRNTNGLIYTSEELFWDGRSHELYSNVFCRVVTPERTIEGTCFKSNETMTRYSVTNSKGSFVNSDIEGDKNEQQPAANGDTTVVQPAIRPASQRHKAGRN